MLFIPNRSLGDLDQLLERNFVGIAKDLDQTRRFSQAYPASKVVNHGAGDSSAGRSTTALGGGCHGS